MKKYWILLMIVLWMFMSGCSSRFAKYEYDSVKKLLKMKIDI